MSRLRSLAIHQLIEKYELKSFSLVEQFFSREPFHFQVRLDPDLNVYSLYYDQIKTDFEHAAAHEARGIFLCAKTNQVVCYPFNKFWNIGEKHAAKIDWETAQVQHKYDGSLIKLYHHQNQWICGTNKVPDAQKASQSNKKTFKDLFDEAASLSGLDYGRLNPDCTYMFEMVHPDNYIVVHYSEPRLYHIGTRNNKTFEELDQFIGVQKAETFPLKSLHDCEIAAKKLGSDQEGFVIKDSAFNRVKLKGGVYVSLHHHMVGKGSSLEETAAMILLQNEQSEVQSYANCDDRIKAISDEIKKMSERVNVLVKEMASIWTAARQEVGGTPLNRKLLAQHLKKHASPKAFSFFMKRADVESSSEYEKYPEHESLEAYFRSALLERYSSQKLKRSDMRAFLELLEQGCKAEA